MPGACWYRLVPSRLGAFDDQARDVAQLIIRIQNVLEGRDRYGLAAERLAERIVAMSASAAESFATPQQRYLMELGGEAIVAAGGLLEALFVRLDPVAAGGTLAEMAASCRALMDTIVLPAGADAEALADDLRSWSAVCGVLDDLAAAADVAGGHRRLTVGRFGDLLRSLLAETPCPPVAAPTAMPAAGALDLRAVRVRHVWLVGLNEGVFPARSADQPLISEADRQRWAARSALGLDVKDDLVAREMLLLYLTVGRADESLTISWRYGDGAGGAAAASGFLDALLAATDESARNVTTLPPAEFAPVCERIGSRRELLNAAMAAAADRSGEANQVAWRAAVGRNLPAAVARPLWAAQRRWQRGPADRYDGVLDDAAILAEFARWFGGEVVLSVSQINTFLGCPWRYFASRSLKLAELPPPSDELLPRRRGQLVHAVLRRMLAALTSTGDVPVEALTSSAAIAALDAAIEAEAARDAGRVRCRGLWQSELRRLRRDLLGYLHHQASSPLPGQRVSKLELAFGMGDAADCDPASAAAPLVLDGPAGPVRLRGKIDRVDRIDVDGVTKAFVIDYKTGSLPDIDHDAQLPVYIKAAAKVLGLPAAGGAMQAVGGRRGERDICRSCCCTAAS